jgi:NAD(P)-dependent dehydrogenase (short-subunit alcohol dehydrogenase family)
MTGPTLRQEFPVNQVPSGRPGEYEEMAATILHLVGKGGGYINGAVSVVDGGRLGVMPATF